MNTAVTRPGHILGNEWGFINDEGKWESRQLDAESYFHNACTMSEQPTVATLARKAKERMRSADELALDAEVTTRRVLDFVMGAAVGVSASFFTLWVALLVG